ncbi:protein disulfide-isomerase precursor [Nowakowskiella sp. JEL0407]|nr:protein disulfide-isomerase precursor [Nowakowskiella sp. JEL0407]
MKQSHEYITFKSVAESVPEDYKDQFIFSLTLDQEKARALNAVPPNIVIYAPDHPGPNVYNGEFTSTAIGKFIHSKSLPLVGEFNEQTFNSYNTRGIPLAFFCHYTQEEKDEYLPFLKKLAKKYQDKISVVTMDASIFSGFIQGRLNLRPEWPAFAVENKAFKYPFKGKLSEKNIEDFVDGVMKGTEKWTVKSEPIPEPKDEKEEDQTVILVGDTFEKIANDTAKDVFITVCADGYPKCKGLAPAWSKLSTYVDKTNITIAYMDGSKNDVPPTAPYRVTKFPTIVLYKAETNEIIPYESQDRSLAKLYTFLKDNAKYGPEMPAIDDGKDEKEGEKKEGEAKESPKVEESKETKAKEEVKENKEEKKEKKAQTEEKKTAEKDEKVEEVDHEEL